MILENSVAFDRLAQTAGIFGTAILVVLITLLLKCITKLKVYGNPAPEAAARKQEATFDILRMGVDLSILGLGTYLAIFKLAHEKVPGVAANLTGWNDFIIYVQLSLLLSTALLTAFYDTPEDGWVKGVWFPFLLGWMSIWISAFLFYYVIR
jgi:hypothetical protein